MPARRRLDPREAEGNRPARASAPGRPRRDAGARGRSQRLCRQGPLRRQDHRLSLVEATSLDVDNSIIVATPCSTAPSRASATSAASPASASPSATRAPSRWSRDGRPWLRIHDRRRGGRARQDGPQLRGGMSGGIAYVLDEEGDFARRCKHGHGRDGTGARGGRASLARLPSVRRPRQPRPGRRHEAT